MTDPVPVPSVPSVPNEPAGVADGDVQSVRGGRPLTGTVTVPGDKSISHRALLLAALAEGTSIIHGLSHGDDVARTLAAVAALGAEVGTDGKLAHRHRWAVPAPCPRRPPRPRQLRYRPPPAGRGGGHFAGHHAPHRGRVATEPAHGSRRRPAPPHGGRGGGGGGPLPSPIAVTGGPLTGITYEPPMASAQVKSAILLAGLGADGETVVHEPVATRAHTEEMLAAAGADIDFTRVGGGRTIRVRRSTLAPGTYAIPGDPSQAAFWVVAAVIVPGSLITVSDIQLGIERLGFLGVLRRMGATIEMEETGNLTGSVTSYTCALHGTVVEAAEIPSLDEVPILAVAAAAAVGTTRFRDIGELRVKESDRLAATAALVRAFGAEATVEGDDLVVEGSGGRLRPADVDANGDHRMAMAAAVAGTACPAGAGETTIRGWDVVATSYPGFSRTLAQLTDSSAGSP